MEIELSATFKLIYKLTYTMAERIILKECDKNKSQSEISIPNGSTFKLTYHFTPLGYSPFPKVELSMFDMTAAFWIYGRESEVIEFTKPSISNDRVIINQQASTVTLLFRNYTLKTGKLYQQLEFKIMDPTIPGEWAEEDYDGFTGITLK